MALSIRSAEVETLARQLASARGETLTEVILQGLRSLAAEQAGLPPRPERLRALAATFQALPDVSPLSSEEFLGYTEEGVFFEAADGS